MTCRRARSRWRGVVAIATAVAGWVLCGCAGASTTDAAPGAKEVDVVMKEMSFTPSRFTFVVGDTVTFHFHNEGRVRHEAVLGDQSVQDSAVAAMRAIDAGTATTLAPVHGSSYVALGHPGMGLPNVISLPPGGVGDITFQFAKATTMFMECHETGHLEAGMKATIRIRQ